MKRGGCVYMMCSINNNAIYTGVTADLFVRVQDHKNKKDPHSFTARYNCIKLVYYINFSTITEAILEEKRIKGGSRKQKESLINSINPHWIDLWETDVKNW